MSEIKPHDPADAQFEALTAPATDATAYQIPWYENGRGAAFADDPAALARHDAGWRSALADMGFAAHSGGAVAARLIDEAARFNALSDVDKEIFRRSQDAVLSRVVGPANVEVARTAANNMLARVKDKGFLAELETKGAFLSATATAQLWLQAQKLALRGQR